LELALDPEDLVLDRLRMRGFFDEVLVYVNNLRALNKRCSLYSVGPSCGSASRLVTITSESGLGDLVRSKPGTGRVLDTDRAPKRGVDVLGVDHGEDTRGGSPSNVKIDREAMASCFNLNVRSGLKWC
jgi:hypothetical protein